MMDDLLKPIPDYMPPLKSLPEFRAFWTKTTCRIDGNGVVLVKTPGCVERPLADILAWICSDLDMLRQQIERLEIRTGLCLPPLPPDDSAEWTPGIFTPGGRS